MYLSAVRGPLGGLGDRLVWAGWLPVSLLVGLVLVAAGGSPAVVVLTFLGVYNAGHLAIRGWAYRVGLAEGPAVSRKLQAVDLAGKTDRIQGLGALLLGGLWGLLLVRASTAGTGGRLWPILVAR